MNLQTIQELQELFIQWFNVSLLFDVVITLSLSIAFTIYSRRQHERMRKLYKMCQTIQHTQEIQAESRAYDLHSVSSEVHNTSIELTKQIKELAEQKLQTHITINNK